MNGFILINSNGEYGIEIKSTGFGGNGSTKLRFTSDLNQASIFYESTFKLLQTEFKNQVVAKIPAMEKRVITLCGMTENT